MIDLLLFIQPETLYGVGVFLASAVVGAVTKKLNRKNDGV
jgi:hypothetical protein